MMEQNTMYASPTLGIINNKHILITTSFSVIIVELICKYTNYNCYDKELFCTKYRSHYFRLFGSVTYNLRSHFTFSIAFSPCY